MTLSDYLSEVEDSLLHSMDPPHPRTTQEYWAVMKQHPDESWRWKASEENTRLLRNPPEPWSREEQLRFMNTLRFDSEFRYELRECLDETRQGSTQAIPRGQSRG